MTQTKSQNAKILAHLQRGWGITPVQAFERYGCFRLAARINNLKNDGYRIVSEMVHKNGVKFAKYSMGRSGA